MHPRCVQLVIMLGAHTAATQMSSCGDIELFHTACLAPLLGPHYGSKSFDMEFTCEALFWRLPEATLETSGLVESTVDCAALAAEVAATESSALKSCDFQYDTYVQLADFSRDCVYFIGVEQPVENEEERLVARSSASALWARSQHTRREPKATRAAAGPTTRAVSALRTATIPEIQPHAKDPVHTRWVSGPTYSGKIRNNRMGDSKWPQFGGAPDEGSYSALILMGLGGTCIKTGLRLGQCWFGGNDGHQLALNSATSAIVDTAGSMVCAFNDPTTPASGVALGLSGSCKNPEFELDESSGLLRHTSTGLCVTPENEANPATSTLKLSACSTWRWGFWTEYNFPPGYSDGFKLGGATRSDGAAWPRYNVLLSNPCEQYKSQLWDEDGAFAKNLIARTSNGVVFPHNIWQVDHIGWPAGSGCRMYFHMYEPNSGNVYPNWLTEWNAIFTAGTTLILETAPTGGTDPCDASRERYTGYSAAASSNFCQRSSSLIDDAPHLMVNSEWAGVVLDASMPNDNILNKLGPISAESAGTWQEIYAALPKAELTGTLTTASGQVYKLSKSLKYASIHPVRHGINVVHLIVTFLRWEGLTSVNDIETPQWWLEFDIWANSVAIQLGWDELGVGAGCGVCETATVSLTLSYGGDDAQGVTPTVITSSAVFEPGAQFKGDGVALFVEFDSAGKSDALLPTPLAVTSSGGTVVRRAPTNDVVIEVSSGWSRCGYGSSCSPLESMDITVANSNAEDGVLRLSVTRNFPSRGGLSGSRVGAEITGLSGVLRDGDGSPIGIPLQVSKKWDETEYKQTYEGRYEITLAGGNNWWTFNVFLRIPAKSEITLSLGGVYNKYGGVPAFSHAQLSLIGYTDSWVWQEASLASLGETICIDTVGSHARAQITDVRVEIFKGFWAENVGGGDYLVYFNAAGQYVYAKALDPMIIAAGPCLSNASYTQTSADDAIEMATFFSGSRTDDFTKNFFQMRYDVKKNMPFSRLAFFQAAADFYQHDEPTDFRFGSAADGSWPNYESVPVGCADQFTYPEGYPYRQAMTGEAPWYFTMKYPNKDDDGWGDRGVVIRSYKAILDGIEQSAPAFSVFCGNLEISVPAGVGNVLLPGDFVEMQVELVVLPRLEVQPTSGLVDFDDALSKTGSRTLTKLSSLASTADMVAAHARGHLSVVAEVGAVESHYPIRVCKVSGASSDILRFTVTGSALGFVPLVLCGLSTHVVDRPHQGLWVRLDGDSEYKLLDQGVHDDTDFWQTNYLPSDGTYEVVFNLELLFDSHSTVSAFAWPTNPSDTQPASTTPSPVPSPLPAPTKHPVPSPTQQPIEPDESGACFHGNGTVLLESGASIPFSEVRLGDVIKTSDGEGNFSFSPVLTLPHDKNTEPAAFLTLITETRKSVDMTSDHFIPQCDTTLVTASELVVGDCLLTTDGKETLTEISSSLKSGVYTAITKDEFIVVDGIVASPFSKNSDLDPKRDYDKYLRELERERQRKLEYFHRKTAVFHKGMNPAADIRNYLRGN